MSQKNDSDKSFLYIDDRLVARLSKRLGEAIAAAREQAPDFGPYAIAGNIKGSRAEEVAQALGAVGNIRAVKGLAAGKRRPSGSVQFRRPFSIQPKILNPERLLKKRLPWLLKFVSSRAPWRLAAMLSVFALTRTLTAVFDGTSSLHASIPNAGEFLGIFTGLFAAMFIHELFRAAALVAFGCKASRLGIMLFYLMPTFFCDVSDSRRLPPRRRVRVALAGILAQGAIAGYAFIVIPFLSRPLGDTVTVFGCLCVVYGLLDLLLFVNLDGCVALAAGLDEPYPREHCMDEAKRSIAGCLV